jgi:hypothetical protein
MEQSRHNMNYDAEAGILSWHCENPRIELSCLKTTADLVR